MDAATRRQRGFVVDPPTGLRDAIRYGLALIVAGVIFAVSLFAFGSAQPDDAALPVDDAIMVDLTPAEVSGLPGDEGADDRARQALAASAGQVAPRAREPPKPDEPPKSRIEPDETPPATAADPATELERERKPPPPAGAPPPAAAREAMTPSGSAARSHTDADRSEDDVPNASARTLSVWEKAMIARLERARRSLVHVSRGSGTTTIAFSIDRGGRLVVERVGHGSGDAALDNAAMTLVKRAAPFPEPPPGANEKDLSFVVPIRFRRR